MNLEPNEIVTEPVRIAFPSLFKPKPVMKGSDDLKWQAALLLPPDYDKKPLLACIKAVMLEKWGKVIKLTGRNMPIKSCAEKDLAGYEDGWFYVNTKSGYQPSVLDQRKQEVLDEDRIFAGCWCRFHLKAYAWDNQFGKGVSFGLEAVQLVRTDERLGGRKPATEVFGEIEVDDLDVDGEGEDTEVDELDELLG